MVNLPVAQQNSQLEKVQLPLMMDRLLYGHSRLAKTVSEDSAIGGSLSASGWNEEVALEAGMLTGQLEMAAAEMEVCLVVIIGIEKKIGI